MAKKKRKKGAGTEKKAVASHRYKSNESILQTKLPLTYQLLISVFILVVAICVLYPELVFQNKQLVAGDVDSALSLATPIRKGLAEGEYPQWNPHLYSGMPSYGSLSYTPYVYPVQVLTGFLITYLKFPAFTWLLFHIFLLGLGVWLLLFDGGIHFLIAVGMGVIIMWMPNHVAVGVHGHGSQAMAVGYIPFALFFWDRLWRGKGILLNGSILTILLGFQFLRAHLQISYYTFAIVGMHLIFFGTLKIRDAVRNANQAYDPVFGLVRRAYERGSISVKRAAMIDVAGAVVTIAIIVFSSLLISAVLFIPVQDYAQYSIRGASEAGGLDYDYATSWSLHPLESLTFIVPFAFGFGKSFYYGHMPFTDYPNYVGVVVVLFALLAVVIVRTRVTWFLAFVVAVTTLVAFGKFLPLLYDPLFNFLPYFNKFRVPVMVLIVQQFALVLLCGLGLSAVVAYDPAKGRKKALWALLFAGGVTFVVLVSYGYWTEGFAQSIAGRIRNVRSSAEQLQLARLAGGLLFKDLVKFSLLLLATTALAWLFFRRYLAALPFVLFVIGIALLDFFLVDRHIIHPEKLFRTPQLRVIKDNVGANRVLEPDALTDFLQAQEGYYRVFPMTHPSSALFGDFRTNRYMNFGISSIGGYHPAKLSIYEEFMEALAPALQRGDFRMVNMLNARYLITSTPLTENPIFKALWRGVDYQGAEKFVYENLEALPRIFFVDRFEVRPGAQALSQLATDRNLDVSETVLLETAPSLVPVSDEGATATITRYKLNEIRIDATLTSPAILVLSEVYYPRWQVWVDGERGEVIRANHVLRAVPLAAGRHEVVFRYDSSLLRRSLAISISVFSLAVCLLLVSVFYHVWGRVKWKRS